MTLLPVLVTARPPRAVSLSLFGMDFATSFMAWITSSNGMKLWTPAITRSEAPIAAMQAMAFLLIQGTSTRPPKGSQASPR